MINDDPVYIYDSCTAVKNRMTGSGCIQYLVTSLLAPDREALKRLV